MFPVNMDLLKVWWKEGGEGIEKAPFNVLSSFGKELNTTSIFKIAKLWEGCLQELGDFLENQQSGGPFN